MTVHIKKKIRNVKELESELEKVHEKTRVCVLPKTFRKKMISCRKDSHEFKELRRSKRFQIILS